jgi:hypothetical protein
MAIASLSRFTVPLAGSQSASVQGLLMPKLKYRFRVTLQNFGISKPTTELTKQVVDVTRPNVTFEEIVIDVYNSKVKLAGKPSWADMTLTLRDDMTNAVTNLVGEQLQKQFDFYEQASASSGIDYKFSTVIEMLDGGNGADTVNVLETWELDGCFLSGADYQQLDYKTSEPVQIALTIKYDNATQLNTAGSPQGVGQNVGRTSGVLITGQAA